MNIIFHKKNILKSQIYNLLEMLTFPHMPLKIQIRQIVIELNMHHKIRKTRVLDYNSSFSLFFFKTMFTFSSNDGSVVI